MFDKIISKKIDLKKLIIVSLAVLFLIYVGKSSYGNYFYLDFIISLILIVIAVCTNIKYLFKVLTIVLLVIYSCAGNSKDTLVSKKVIYSNENINQEKLIKKIPKGYDHTTLYNLKLGETVDLDVTFDPVDASIRDILWQTKDSYVATVDASGVVTAKDYGKTVITATTKNGKSATCIINVTK